MSPRTVLALVLVALAALPPAALSSGSAPTFAAPVTLPSSAGFGEPSIAVSPLDGTVYVTAPCPASPVWRSTNDGATFARVASSRGSCGDSDVAVDAAGTLYVSDLFTNVPVSVSNDRGSTFAFATQSAAPGGSIDRQWLAAGSAGKVWSIWRDGSTERVAVSTDGAVTWTRVVAATSVAYQGGILAASDQDLYIPYTSGFDARLMVSHNGGLAWTTKSVARTVGDSYLFPAIAKDDGARLYYAWAEGSTSEPYNIAETPQVAVRTSTDDGASWTAKTMLSTPGTYNIFPWAFADATGKAAVAWLEGVPPAGVASDPNAAVLTAWYVKVAYTADGGASWTTTRATGQMHLGPICTFGILCFPASNPVALNRQLLDFFEIAELANGNLVIAYSGDQNALNTNGGTNLYVVRQNGGPNLH